MADWVPAAVADAGDRPVVVVTGGFHRPALVARIGSRRLAARRLARRARLPAGAVGGSYLVPFSFRRLDAFDGYQSGMPSPALLPAAVGGRAGGGRRRHHRHRRRAAARAVGSRSRRPTSSPPAPSRSGWPGSAAIPHPARTDVLDGLVSALVTEALDRPLPWTGRGRLAAGTDPVVVEMVAALAATGSAGCIRRHPAPAAGRRRRRRDGALRHRRRRSLRRRPDDTGRTRRAAGCCTACACSASRASSADPGPRRARSRPGRDLGAVRTPSSGCLRSSRRVRTARPSAPRPARRSATGSLSAGNDAVAVAAVLFDAALCGLADLSERVLADLRPHSVGTITDLGGLGDPARHCARPVAPRPPARRGRHRRARRASSTRPRPGRCGWWKGSAADRPRPTTAGCRPSSRCATPSSTPSRSSVPIAPPCSVSSPARRPRIGRPTCAERRSGWCGRSTRSGRADRRRSSGPSAAPAGPASWATSSPGLFALAREQVIGAAPPGIVGLLDEIIGRFDEADFLVALPALRLAFSWFPPREREAIAHRVLEGRGIAASPAALLRLASDPTVVARGRALEARVDDLLAREALLGAGDRP